MQTWPHVRLLLYYSDRISQRKQQCRLGNVRAHLHYRLSHYNIIAAIISQSLHNLCSCYSAFPLKSLTIHLQVDEKAIVEANFNVVLYY